MPCRCTCTLTFLLSIIVLGVLYLSALLTSSSVHIPTDSPGPYPNESPHGIFWFLHISDIHMATKHPQRTQDFIKFTQNHVNLFGKETMILATGDYTGSSTNGVFSYQDEDDWKIYHNVLKNASMNCSRWIDIRGNHDDMYVPKGGPSDPHDYFSHYSMCKEYSPNPVYEVVKKTSFGTYSFVGLDTTPRPGMNSPQNFFGVISNTTFVTMEGALQRAKERQSNMTFVFAHHPTATINLAPRERFISLLQKHRVHSLLCGHMHLSKMYTRIGKTWELEVSDWKHHRGWRLIAVDHDMLSFVDQEFTPGDGQTAPVILITNPKDSRYLSHYEPIGRIAKSTHVRVLIFTPLKVHSAYIFFEDHSMVKTTLTLVNATQGQNGQNELPLYTAPWNPSEYSKGVHKITAVVTLRNGTSFTTYSVSQPFSIDGTAAVPQASAGRLMQPFPLLMLPVIAAILIWLISMGALFGGRLMLVWLRRAHPRHWVILLASCVEKQPLIRMHEEAGEFAGQEEKIPQLGWFKRHLIRAFYPYGYLPLPYWLVLVVLGFVLPLAPCLIGPFMGNSYGASFSWGAIVRNHYQFEGLAMVIFAGSLLFLYSSLVGTTVHWFHPRPKHVIDNNPKEESFLLPSPGTLFSIRTTTHNLRLYENPNLVILPRPRRKPLAMRLLWLAVFYLGGIGFCVIFALFCGTVETIVCSPCLMGVLVIGLVMHICMCCQVCVHRRAKRVHGSVDQQMHMGEQQLSEPLSKQVGYGKQKQPIVDGGDNFEKMLMGNDDW